MSFMKLLFYLIGAIVLLTPVFAIQEQCFLEDSICFSYEVSQIPNYKICSGILSESYLCVESTVNNPSDFEFSCDGANLNGFCIDYTVQIKANTITPCNGFNSHYLCVESTVNDPETQDTHCEGILFDGFCIEKKTLVQNAQIDNCNGFTSNSLCIETTTSESLIDNHCDGFNLFGFCIDFSADYFKLNCNEDELVGPLYYDGDTDGYHNDSIIPRYFCQDAIPPTWIEEATVDCDDTSSLATRNQYYDNDGDFYYNSTLGQLTSCEKYQGVDYTKLINDSQQLGVDCDDTSLLATHNQYYDNDGDFYYNSTLGQLTSCEKYQGVDYTKLINDSQQLGVDCDDTSSLATRNQYYDNDGDFYYNSTIGYMYCSEYTDDLDYTKLINSSQQLGVDCDDNNEFATSGRLYYDGDGDGYINNSIQPIDVCNGDPVPDDFSSWTTSYNGYDCNDNNEYATTVNDKLYLDNDGDGYYDLSSEINSCAGETLPTDLTNWDFRSTYISIDCDDTTALRNESLSSLYYQDQDEDTYHDPLVPLRPVCVGESTQSLVPQYSSSGIDCDDTNSSLNVSQGLFYVDNDNDFFHNNSIGEVYLCEGESTTDYIRDYLSLGPDCDDTNPKAGNDTYGLYKDGDGDGYYNDSQTLNICLGDNPQPLNEWNFASEYLGVDCDDTNATRKNVLGIHYTDLDGDSFYNDSDDSVLLCVGDSTQGLVLESNAKGLDCDDTNSKAGNSTYGLYRDSDGDGYYDDSQTLNICLGDNPQPLNEWNFASEYFGVDCDDTNDTKYSFEEFYVDNDNDRYYNASIEPVEFCGGDNIDGFIRSPIGEDIDDSNPNIWGIGGPEICDGVDNNGDGLIDENACYCEPVNFNEIDLQLLVDTSGSFSNELNSLDIANAYNIVIENLENQGYDVSSEIRVIYQDYYGLSITHETIELGCDALASSYYKVQGMGNDHENEAWALAGYCGSFSNLWRDGSLKTQFILADEGPCGSDFCSDSEKTEITNHFIDKALEKSIQINTFNDGCGSYCGFYTLASSSTGGNDYGYSQGINSVVSSLQEAMSNLTQINCEPLCPQGSHYDPSSASCLESSCLNIPSDATLCGGDNINPSFWNWVNPNNYAIVVDNLSSCTPQRNCEYYCPEYHVFDAENNRCIQEYETCELPNGTTVGHNTQWLLYEESPPPLGEQCNSELRVCNNGTLSGSFEFDSCTEDDFQYCTLPNGEILEHNNSIILYENEQVLFGENCNSQKRTCFDGELNGSYEYDSCIVQEPICTGEIPNNATSCISQPLNSGTITLVQECSVDEPSCEYTCDEGFILNGSICELEEEVICLDDEVWNESLQQCVDVTCPENQVWNESLQQCVPIEYPRLDITAVKICEVQYDCGVSDGVCPEYFAEPNGELVQCITQDPDCINLYENTEEPIISIASQLRVESVQNDFTNEIETIEYESEESHLIEITLDSFYSTQISNTTITINGFTQQPQNILFDMNNIIECPQKSKIFYYDIVNGPCYQLAEEDSITTLTVFHPLSKHTIFIEYAKEPQFNWLYIFLIIFIITFVAISITKIILKQSKD